MAGPPPNMLQVLHGLWADNNRWQDQLSSISFVREALQGGERVLYCLLADSSVHDDEMHLMRLLEGGGPRHLRRSCKHWLSF